MTRIKTVLSLLVLLCLLSFTPASKIVKTGVNIGDKIDQTSVSELHNALKTNSGSLVLINCWASYDANSRIENIKLAQLADKYKDKQFKNARSFAMISLSFDNYQSVFTETVKRDNLENVENVLVKQGFESKLAKSYRLENESFGNFLLDSKGVIVAKNITATDLETWLKQN